MEDERDQERQPIDARPEGTGRLRAGVVTARAGVEQAGESVRDGGARAWLCVEDTGWFLRERLLWPAQDGLDALGPRGRIGVFGGGAVAIGAVIAALAISTGGSSPDAGTTEAFVVRHVPAPAVSAAPAAKPKKKAAKPTGPTLHGAAPDFAPAKNVKAGVGAGKAVEKELAPQSSTDPEAPAQRGAGEAPASSAKIGATPQASASAQAQADSLATGNGAGVAEDGTDASGVGLAANGGEGSDVTGPVAPKAAKQTARRFAEAFVVYEVGGIDGKVRRVFGKTGTKQLSRALLHRPPRQPAAVKVPRAKVVNVVAGPSREGVYPVSVSLLRVGVTSELRLELEPGAGKQWQVTNVLG
jgi:hypothetical protein